MFKFYRKQRYLIERISTTIFHYPNAITNRERMNMINKLIHNHVYSSRNMLDTLYLKHNMIEVVFQH